MIKVTQNDKVKLPELKRFPRMMISDGGRVVLFSRDRCGIALTGEGQIQSKSWSMVCFTDYEGSITIQNEVE